MNNCCCYIVQKRGRDTKILTKGTNYTCEGMKLTWAHYKIHSVHTSYTNKIQKGPENYFSQSEDKRQRVRDEGR